MLRRVENVSLFIGVPGWLGPKPTNPGYLYVTVGSKKFISSEKLYKNNLDEMLSMSSIRPVVFTKTVDKTLWNYQGKWYWENEGLSEEEVFALLTAREVRAKKSIDRAKSIAGMASATPTQNKRGHISAESRQVVWMRDGGSCTSCGSNVELQFDHIIPVAMGGATNEDNLQILCGPCNRVKGNSVG